MSDEVRIRRLWGSDDSYYKELEDFHRKHEAANAIEYDNESKVPVKAVYYFRPWNVYVDDMRLRDAIHKANLEQEADDGEE